jgi:hypothetical protein
MVTLSSDPRLTRTPRVSDRLLGLLGVRLALFAVAARQFLPGVLESPFALAAYHDDHFYYAHEDIGRITLARFHELPIWNPYYCGGIPGLGNPQDVSLAPDFILRLMFGTGPGRHLAVYLFTLMGMEGVYRLARRYDASVVASMMAGAAFATSARFPPLLHDGWVHMFAYDLLPWVALCFLEGITSRAYRLWGGFFLAWMVLCGGTYVVPHTGVLLAVLLVWETLSALRASEESAPRWYFPARSLAVMGLVALGLSAVRVFPMLHVIAAHPRLVPGTESTQPFAVLASLVMKRGDPMASAGDAYIGSFVVALGGLALLCRDRAAAYALAIAGVFAVLAMGAFAPFAPWTLLHKAPIFSQLRVPNRIIVIAQLYFALAGARGLTLVEDAFPSFMRWLEARRASGSRVAPIFVALAAVMGTLLTAVIGYRAAKDVVEEDTVAPHSLYVMDPPLTYEDTFRQSRGNRWDQQVWAPASRGSLACFEETEFFQSPKLRGDLPAEEYAAPGSDADVQRLDWSPHRIELRVNARAPSTILVNQNWAPAWRSNVGTVVSEEGLLGIRVPPGEHHMILRHRDSRALFGAAVSFGTLGALLFLGWRQTRRWTLATIARVRALPWWPPRHDDESITPPGD